MPARTVQVEGGSVTLDDLGLFPTPKQLGPWKTVKAGTKVKFRARLNGAYTLLLGNDGVWHWNESTLEAELLK